MRHNTMQYNTTQSRTIHYITMQYNMTNYTTIHYTTLQYNTLHSTPLHTHLPDRAAAAIAFPDPQARSKNICPSVAPTSASN